MKTIFKYAYAAVIGAIVAFASCTNDYEYTPAQKPAQEVFFPSSQPTKLGLSPAESTFELPVMRAATPEAVTVPVKVTISEGSKITCQASSIEFAAEQEQGALSFAYNPEEMEYDVYDTITVEIDPAYSSPYGNSKLTLLAGVAAPWQTLGEATFVENYYWSFEIDINIEQNQLEPTLYRMANPYATVFNLYNMSVSNEASEYLYIRVLQKGEEFREQTIESDGLVYFYGDSSWKDEESGNTLENLFNTGYFHTTYSADLCIVHPCRFTSLSDQSNWGCSRVLDYKEDGSIGAIQLAGNYYMFGVGGYGGQDKDGNITIYMPGYDPKDYSLDIEAAGRYIDAAENGYAIFNVSLGADVEEAKIAMSAGKDPNVAYSLIVNGDASVQTITASGEVRIPYEGGGDFTVLMVGYDAEGNEVNAVYDIINVPVGGSETNFFEAMYVGTYTHGVKSFVEDGSIMWENEDGTPYSDDTAVLYGNTENPGEYMISPWLNKGWAENDTEGEGLVFNMFEDGSVTVPCSYTGVNAGDYGEIFAWDFVTAGAADIPSGYDSETGTFNFYLAWSVTAGHFGFTLDTYQLTGTAAARPSKAASRLRKDSKMPTLISKLTTDVEGKPLAGMKKAAKKHNFSFKTAGLPNAKIKK